MTKIIAISDTHGMHKNVGLLPECDVLIHAGDFSCGRDDNPQRFLEWFEGQPATKKILISGNHDGCAFLHPKTFRDAVTEFSPSTTYLNDNEVNIEGITFWGSPWTPTFLNWYFMAERGGEIRAYWDLIPDTIDVLITHGPMWGRLDTAWNQGEHLGCRDLYEEVIGRIHPLIHICGHIHGSHNQHHRLVHDNGDVTRCYNVSIADEDYNPNHPPTIIEL